MARCRHSNEVVVRLKPSKRVKAGALSLDPGYRSRYRLRKQIVEPVFGHIKQARGFRQFLLRGLEAVQAEWALICTTPNITKLAKAI